MASPGGRRLRPLAVLCALLLVAWGAASAGSLIAQVQDWNDILDANGDSFEGLDAQYITSLWLFILGAASGCWVTLWGLLGLGWRPPLHLGILALVVAVALEISANAVQAAYIGDLSGSWSFGDQLRSYGERITFSADGVPARLEARAFFEALPLVTAVLPFLTWMVVLVSGAGTKVRYAPGYGVPPYGAPPAYQQPAYQHQVYQQPVYQQPVYQPPVYQPPPQLPYRPQHHQQPVPPPAPWQEPPPAPPARVPWQDVPPVLPRGRPTPPPTPPEQHDTLPYRGPPGGS